METVLFDFPANWCVSGATGCGKTFWVYKLLQHKDSLFKSPPKVILYCYSIWQPLFDLMEKDLGVKFYKGVPTLEELMLFGKNSDHKLICLDDLQQEVVNNKTVEKLFTQLCHHLCISVIYINQNLFYQGKCARTLHLNTAYNVLLKNQRNIEQIGILGRQIGLGKMLVEAYKDAIASPYGYLIVDLSPKATPAFQLRTHIFPDEFPIVIYK